MSENFSINPGGEKFPLPKPEEYKAEFENLKNGAYSQSTMVWI